MIHSLNLRQLPLLALVIGILTALQLSSGVSAQEESTTIRVSPVTQTVPAGSNVLVDVVVENAPSFSAYEFHLSFDPTVLECISVTAAETFLESTGRTADCFGPDPEDLAIGIISFACASLGATPGPAGNGVLATLVFATSCSGSSALEFAQLPADELFVDAVSLSDALARHGYVFQYSVLGKFEKPFLTLFGRLDPNLGSEEVQNQFINHVPGAQGQPHDHFDAHHFLQEDIGALLAERVNAFIADNPASAGP